MKKLIAILLLIVGLFLLFHQENLSYGYGVLFLIVGLYILFSKGFISQIRNQDMESIANNVNCLFRISLKIDEILDHEILKAYFSSDAFSQKERNLYKKIKLNAEELIKRGDMIPNLKINIKNGNIYKNGTLVFEDNFYCSFFIPYDLKNFKKDHYSRYGGVTIRVLIVNGFLDLQVGDFGPSGMNTISTEDIAGGNYHTYQSFYSLVSIPLIYHCPLLGLSKKHLNITAEGIDGYYSKEPLGKEIWSNKWKKLHQALEEYTYLISTGHNDAIDGKSQEIMKKFQEKSAKIFKDQDLPLDKIDSYYTHPDLAYIQEIKTNYMDIEIHDLNYWFSHNYAKDSSLYTKQEFYL